MVRRVKSDWFLRRGAGSEEIFCSDVERSANGSGIFVVLGVSGSTKSDIRDSDGAGFWLGRGSSGVLLNNVVLGACGRAEDEGRAVCDRGDGAGFGIPT